MKLPKINNTHLFWTVYLAFLLVLLPQEAWTIGQGQDQTGSQWAFLGVTASPLAWFLAGAFSASIAIVTHRLNVHWLDMPKRYKADDMAKKRFAYRWLNVYAVALILTMVISSIANFMHVVQFTNKSLVIFAEYPWAVSVYQFIFGLALPGVSFVFARVLSTMQESEQEDDPALAKANADLKEANTTIRSMKEAIRQAEQSIRETEQQYSVKLQDAERLLSESEQRFRAAGDVLRYLFGTDLALRDRIRGIRMTHPNLSQNRIAQLIGCSVSTVNDNLQGFEVELPEVIEQVPA